MPEMTQYQRRVRMAADRFKARVPRIAAMKSPPVDSSKLTPEKERMLFWVRDPDANEQQLWAAVMQEAPNLGMDMNTAIQIATPNIVKAVFPHRLDVIRAGERVNDTSKQIQFVKRMLEQGPPEDMP